MGVYFIDVMGPPQRLLAALTKRFKVGSVLHNSTVRAVLLGCHSNTADAIAVRILSKAGNPTNYKVVACLCVHRGYTGSQHCLTMARVIYITFERG